jgi:hypothetical protein
MHSLNPERSATAASGKSVWISGSRGVLDPGRKNFLVNRSFGLLAKTPLKDAA